VGPEVAGVRILGVGDRGWFIGGDVLDGGEEAVEVVGGGGQTGAGPDGSRYLAAVSPADGLVVRTDLGGAEIEEPQQVGVGAEAAVADADGVLGAEPGGDQRVGDAVDDECRHRESAGPN